GRKHIDLFCSSKTNKDECPLFPPMCRFPPGLVYPQGPYERFPSCFPTSHPPFPSLLGAIPFSASQGVPFIHRLTGTTKDQYNWPSAFDLIVSFDQNRLNTTLSRTNQTSPTPV